LPTIVLPTIVLPTMRTNPIRVPLACGHLPTSWPAPMQRPERRRPTGACPLATASAYPLPDPTPQEIPCGSSMKLSVAEKVIAALHAAPPGAAMSATQTPLATTTESSCALSRTGPRLMSPSSTARPSHSNRNTWIGMIARPSHNSQALPQLQRPNQSTPTTCLQVESPACGRPQQTILNAA
jgi:hypothetical protein